LPIGKSGRRLLAMAPSASRLRQARGAGPTTNYPLYSSEKYRT